MRKLARSVARAKMKKQGLTKINKKRGDGPSFFSDNWRRYAGMK